ncbi:FAD-dependent oxidoreductase [Synechococcus sp. H55.9]|uniref:dihydrolipoyl dehydrogenase family protein n=1 Tax=Synechococcus sp. H55.9 TaxID=2964511 RepID=UPI0039C4D982
MELVFVDPSALQPLAIFSPPNAMSVPYDLVVIGAGAAGLVVASAAAQLQAKVLLVEASDRLGGDCLWYGCVPSKALLCVAHTVQRLRRSVAAGWVASPSPAGIAVDYLKVYEHIRATQSYIANHADSPDRFRQLGVELVFGKGRFVDGRTFEVAGKRVRARAFVVATGSRPAVPPLPGLAEAGYLTNESIFDLTRLPRSVAVMGAGPVGCELGQALARLGSEVTLIASRDHILPKVDPEAAQVVQQQLAQDGIRLLTQVRAVRAGQEQGEKLLYLKAGTGSAVGQLSEAGEAVIRAEEILVAAGRIPNVEGLGLEAAGVRYTPQGIQVNSKLQTSNPRIYACGDVIGGPQFTHVAAYEAAVALVNALFFPISRARYQVIPWAIFTEPELAQVGLTESEARQQYGKDVMVLKQEFAEVDRAQAEAAPLGFAKVICRRNGQILGAHLVGSQAGELIHEVVLAMSRRLPVPALTGIHIYPTRSQVNAKVALQYRKQQLAANPRLQNFLQGFFAWRRAWS